MDLRSPAPRPSQTNNSKLIPGPQNLERMLCTSLETFRDHSDFSRYAFLSVYLTDFYTVKCKKNFVKNCPQLGLNPGPLGHHSNALQTVLAWYVLARRFLK